jgi:hypothetical protein
VILKRYIYAILCLLTFLTFFSGVIRHDVSEESYLQLARQKQFDCVGQIYKDTLPSASCVLIGDRFVLSAAHIFIESDTRKDTMNLNGQIIIVNARINLRIIDINKLFVLINGKKQRF